MKFHQNKKRIDPRYFLDEQLDEQDTTLGQATRKGAADDPSLAPMPKAPKKTGRLPEPDLTGNMSRLMGDPLDNKLGGFQVPDPEGKIPEFDVLSLQKKATQVLPKYDAGDYRGSHADLEAVEQGMGIAEKPKTPEEKEALAQSLRQISQQSHALAPPIVDPITVPVEIATGGIPTMTKLALKQGAKGAGPFVAKKLSQFGIGRAIGDPAKPKESPIVKAATAATAARRHQGRTLAKAGPAGRAGRFIREDLIKHIVYEVVNKILQERRS